MPNVHTHTIEQVNRMSHEELARLWRFGKVGEWLTGDPVTKRAEERLFREFGGITPELSKRIGWEN